MGKNPRICIVGAGIIGLSTAVKLLQDESFKVEIVVMASSFTPETTSDGAAGYWEPFCVGDTPKEKILEWAMETYNLLLSEASSPEAADKGCFPCTAYKVENTPVEPESFMKRSFGFRILEEEETRKLFPNFSHGFVFTTCIVEGKKYLPHLTKLLSLSGHVTFEQRTLDRLTELSGEGFDVVVNCTGLGARSLVDDDEVRPIRGQVLRVIAPWIKHCVFTDASLGYVLVNSETVVIGGTAYYDDWNSEVDDKDTEMILERTRQLVPSLKDAKIVNKWVGLRPGRSRVRLEKEVFRCDDDEVKVVHNYGHGGAGLSVFWGCATDAVQMVKEFIQSEK